MCHLGALARCTSGEVVGVNNCAVEATTCGIKNDTGTVGSTAHDKDVVLGLGVLEALQVLVSALHGELKLDSLLGREVVEFSRELLGQDGVDHLGANLVTFFCLSKVRSANKLLYSGSRLSLARSLHDFLSKGHPGLSAKDAHLLSLLVDLIVVVRVVAERGASAHVESTADELVQKHLFLCVMEMLGVFYNHKGK